MRVRFGILTVAAFALCLGLASTVPAQDIEQKEVVQEEQVMAPTPWGAPVLISPASGVKLWHYPRATTLAWNAVIGAVGYKIERQYQSGTVWVPYPVVSVTGQYNTLYTFDFVGDQPGRWRVAAFNGVTYSVFSAWRTFLYVTKAQLYTPLLTSPASSVILHHFPRTTTLAWKMVPGAVGYKVEIMYCSADKVTCWAYAPVIVNGYLHSWDTFTFVGAQPGKWRVTALGGTTYSDSVPTSWRWFIFDI